MVDLLNIFRNVFHRTNYGESEPINFATKLFNNVSHLLVDGISRGSFRNQVKASTQSLLVRYELEQLIPCRACMLYLCVRPMRSLTSMLESALVRRMCLCHEFSLTIELIMITALSSRRLYINCDFYQLGVLCTVS